MTEWLLNIEPQADVFFFSVLPYLAFALFFGGTVYRYRTQAFSYSSLSSQFLENKHHFWAMVPFHYGILVVLAGHFVAFLVPRQILWWNSIPLRLWILEASALVFALLSLVGLLAILVRRRTTPRVRVVTSTADWILYLLLLVQIGAGIWLALAYPWGSSWFASSMAPYLWSLIKLSPEIHFVGGMPWLIKLHIINAFVLIGFFPFTRLVHILVTPNPYLWRKRQVVRWYSDRRTARAVR